jgi:hypothetical protein
MNEKSFINPRCAGEGRSAREPADAAIFGNLK